MDIDEYLADGPVLDGRVGRASLVEGVVVQWQAGLVSHSYGSVQHGRGNVFQASAGKLAARSLRFCPAS